MVRERISSAIAALPRPPADAATGSPVTTPFTSADRTALRHFLAQGWVITYMDKCSNNMVIACRKHYVQRLARDLSSGAIYNPCDTPLPLLLRRATEFLAEHQLPVGAAAVSTYATIYKFHKPVIAERFLALSADVFSTPANMFFTALLRTLMPDTERLWDDLIASCPSLGKPPYKGNWILKHSAAALPILQGFNRARGGANVDTSAWSLECYDFERLYTNLDLHHPIDGVVPRLRSLIRRLWESYHGASAAVRVSSNKSTPADWLPSVPAQLHSVIQGPRGAEDTYVFTLDTALDVCEWLLTHAYVLFGDRVFLQAIGIPMGSNCAVYVANMYLFTYELAFLQQLVTAVSLSPRPPHVAS
jgi:hypothetical protein